jgi:hypothetical protein
VEKYRYPKQRCSGDADALRIELAALDDGDLRGMRKVAASLIKEALKGNIAALKEIADRIDGKAPIQQVITGEEDGGAVRYYAEAPQPAAMTEEWLAGNPVRHAKVIRHTLLSMLFRVPLLPRYRGSNGKGGTPTASVPAYEES